MLLNSGTRNYALTATEDGGEYALNVSAATSAAWVAGSYAYVIQAAKGGEVFQPSQGALTITAAFGASPAQLTQLETDLASIDSAIRKVIESGGIKAHRISVNTVSDREYQWMDLADLRKHRIWILGEIERSKKALGVASKKAGYRRVKSVLK